MVLSPDVRGMTLVNYYTGYIVNSPDLSGMAHLTTTQATWSILLMLEEWAG